MKKVESLGGKTVNRLIETAKYGWPPDCVGYIYQPERPKMVSRREKHGCKEKTELKKD